MACAEPLTGFCANCAFLLPTGSGPQSQMPAYVACGLQEALRDLGKSSRYGRAGPKRVFLSCAIFRAFKVQRSNPPNGPAPRANMHSKHNNWAKRAVSDGDVLTGTALMPQLKGSSKEVRIVFVPNTSQKMICPELGVSPGRREDRLAFLFSRQDARLSTIRPRHRRLNRRSRKRRLRLQQ